MAGEANGAPPFFLVTVHAFADGSEGAKRRNSPEERDFADYEIAQITEKENIALLSLFW